MGVLDNVRRALADVFRRPSFAGTPFPDGGVAQAAQLREELGGSGTFNFGGFIRGEDFNPQMDGPTAIKNLDEMRRSDAQSHAALEVVKMPIRTANYEVDPADPEDPESVAIANFVKWNLFDGMTTTWDDVVRQSLLMLDFGFMLFEKVWTVQEEGEYKEFVVLHKLAPRPPKTLWQWFTDEDGSLLSVKQLTVKAGTYQFLDIPASKLVRFTFQQEGDNFAGISMLRTAYPHWLIKKQLYVIDAIRATRYGVGIPRAKLQPGYKPTAEDRAAMAQMLQGLSSHQHAYLIQPPQVEVDILMPQGVRGGVELLSSIDHQNEQITRNILAQFLDMGGKSQGGSRALGASAMDFFLNAIESIANQLCDVLNKQVVKDLVDMNFTTTKYPTIRAVGIGDPNVQALATAAQALAASGLLTPDKATENTFRSLMNLPEVKDVVLPVQPGGAPPPVGVGPGAGAAAGASGNLLAPAPPTPAVHTATAPTTATSNVAPGGPAQHSVSAPQPGHSLAPPGPAQSTAIEDAEAILPAGAPDVPEMEHRPRPSSVSDGRQAKVLGAVAPHAAAPAGAGAVLPTGVVAPPPPQQLVHKAVSIPEVDPDAPHWPVNPHEQGMRPEIPPGYNQPAASTHDPRDPTTARTNAYLTLPAATTASTMIPATSAVREPVVATTAVSKTVPASAHMARSSVPSSGDADEEGHSWSEVALSTRHRPRAARWRLEDGQTSLWRQPTALESRVLNLREMPRRLDTARSALLATLRDVREEQILRIASAVAHAADPSSLKAPLVGKLSSDIAKAMTEIYEYGYGQVRDELRKQAKHGGAAKFADQKRDTWTDPKSREHLVASARVSAQTASDRLLQHAQTESLRLQRAGWDRDEIEDALKISMGELSDADISRIASSEINEGFSLGRVTGAADVKDEIETVVYSAILDDKVCDVCEALDGKEFDITDDAYDENMPPNPNCQGGDACRCTYIYVLKQADVDASERVLADWDEGKHPRDPFGKFYGTAPAPAETSSSLPTSDAHYLRVGQVLDDLINAHGVDWLHELTRLHQSGELPARLAQSHRMADRHVDAVADALRRGIRLLVDAGRSLPTVGDLAWTGLTPGQLERLISGKALADWDESEHPRDGDGKFATGAGDSGAQQQQAEDHYNMLHREAESGIAAVDKLLPDAIANADYTADASGGWESVSSDQQDKIRDAWIDEQMSDDSEYTDAQYEAISSYVQDHIDWDAVHDSQVDDFVDRMAQKGIDVDRDSIVGNGHDNDGDHVAVSKADGTALSADEQKTADQLWGRAYDSAYEEIESNLRDSQGAMDAAADVQRADAQDAWGNLSDDARMDWAKDNGFANRDIRTPGAPTQWKWDDPAGSLTDYQRTGAIARALTEARGDQLLKERGLAAKSETKSQSEWPRLTTHDISYDVWDNWKDSSSSPKSLSLQLAATREFGAVSRLSPADEQTALEAAVMRFTSADERQARGLDRMDFNGARANKELQELAMGRLQAFTRAQWETTQYVMAKAGVNQFDSYRGIMLNSDLLKNETKEPVIAGSGYYDKLPNLQLQRNGLQSATSNERIANDWHGVGTLPPNATRVVLRFSAPREAAFSIPVFGQNVHSEKEIVLMGARSGIRWDAWLHRAPSANQHKIHMREWL